MAKRASDRAPASRLAGWEGLSVALCLLIAIAVVEDRTTREIEATAESVDATRLVLTALSELDGALARAGEARRGYSLSADEAHARAAEAALAEVHVLEKQLATLTHGNTDQQERLRAITPLIEKREGIIRTSIEATRAHGFDRDREAALTDSAVLASRQVNQVRRAMEGEELRLLNEHRARSSAHLKEAHIIELVGTLVSLGLLLLVWRRLRAETRARTQSETQERTNAIELEDTHAFLDSIVENVPVMLFVKDAKDLRFRRLNRGAEILLGKTREEFLGKNDFDFFPAEQARFFQAKDREVLKQAHLVEIVEEPIDTANGRRWLHTKKIPIVDSHGGARYLLGISEDITEKRAQAELLKGQNAELERRVAERTQELTRANSALEREMKERENAEAALLRSEEQLRQAQKMEALGRLAGGIAHDFNNVLTIILGYLDLWEQSSPDTPPTMEEIREVGQAGKRAADMTRQLLAFSRQQVLAPVSLDLNETISGVEKMLRRVIGENIDLRWQPAPALERVTVDPGQVEQVILNLVLNARDAMPEGGTLTIETGNVEIDEAAAAEHMSLVPGPHVMLTVRDTGTGMSLATRTRIFEPFFTTKELGKGTGLGLATVLGIVQQSGGSVRVDSELGQGATFRIYFPKGDLNGDVTHAARHPVLVPRGSETILLVEDEAGVRTVIRTILRKGGYAVLEAKDGADALRICENPPAPIDLLLTDVVMPGLTGRELVERAVKLQPALRVLLMSGYADDSILQRGALNGAAFLQKPITPERLSKKIRDVLDGADEHAQPT